jgi:heme A synthase
MSEHTIRILARDNDRLKHELDLERGKRRALTGTTWLFGLIAVGLGILIDRWAVYAWVAVLLFGFAALIVGTSIWAAKRGDREMGIGDTQGRDNG